MKKIFSILFVIILILSIGVGCNNKSTNEGNNDMSILEFNMNDMRLIEKILDEYTSEKVVGETVYLEKYYTAEEVIEEIQPILIEVFGQDEVSDKNDINISYDSKNEIWLIERSEITDEVGGGLNVLISKATGEVLAIWGTE